MGLGAWDCRKCSFQSLTSDLSVVGGGWVGGRDKRTSWSDLVGVRQKLKVDLYNELELSKIKGSIMQYYSFIVCFEL